MKRISINIILIVGFILLMAAVVLPFVAEVEFDQAKKLEVGYRWKRAGEKYQAAAHLNPLNAEYFAGAGDFLMRQCAYRKDKVSWFRRAKGLYERAIQLNPRHAEHWCSLGRLWIGTYRNEEIDGNGIDKAFDNFREAIEMDRYNFRNNYLIGYSLLTVWSFLDDEEKEFTLDRLKYVLQLNPGYAGRYVYPAVMYHTEDFSIAQKVTPETLAAYKNLYSFIEKNNLGQYRKGVAERVDFYRQREAVGNEE